MQISINKDLLLRSLAKIQSLVEKKSTIPILEHVKIEVAYSYMRLTTTNSEIMISDVFPIKSNFTISFTTVATILYGIVSKIYDAQEIVFIIESEKELVIKAGRGKFRLPCMPAADFPNFETNVTEYTFSMKAGVLRYLFEHTKHAICSREISYYLNGAFFHVVSGNENEQILRVVSTDSFRFASSETKIDTLINEKFGLIVPRKTVHELLKLIGSLDNEVAIQVAADHSRVIFTTPETQLSSKIVDAIFPDYSKIICIKNDKVLTVSVRDLKSAIDLVAAVSDARDKEIKLIIDQETINISTEDALVRQSYGSQVVQAIFNGAEKIEISLNYGYLLECLGAIKGEVVKIGIEDGFSPIMIQDRDDDKSLYVLMPVSAQR